MTRPWPRIWNREELADHRQKAVDVFIRWFQEKGTAAYEQHFQAARIAVERLFRSSEDLLAFGAATVDTTDRSIRDAARYLAGPPLSGDDLKILAGMERVW